MVEILHAKTLIEDDANNNLSYETSNCNEALINDTPKENEINKVSSNEIIVDNQPKRLILAELTDTELILYDPLDNAYIQKIDADDLIGCNFVVQIENLRESAVGLITIVTRKVGYSAADWYLWTQIWCLCIVVYITIFMLLGVLSSLVILIMWLSCLFTLSKPLSNSEILIRNKKLGKCLQYTLLSSICTILIYIYIIGFTPHSNSIIGTSLTIGFVVTSLFYSQSKISLPSLPTIQIPIVLHYENEDIVHLLSLRKKFFNNGKFKKLVTENWIGSQTVEMILSCLLSASIYNSPNVRYYIHVLLDYMLPMYTVMRGIGALLPQCEVFFSFILVKTRADIGLGLIWYMALSHGRIISNQLYFLVLNCQYVWKPLQTFVCSNAISFVSGILVSPLYSCTMLTMKVISNALFTMTTPFHSLILYGKYLGTFIKDTFAPLKMMIGSILQPLLPVVSVLCRQLQQITSMLISNTTLLLSPVIQLSQYFFTFLYTGSQYIILCGQTFLWLLSGIWSYTSTAFYSSFVLCKDILVVVIGLCRGILLKPMPVPNVAQVTTGVVTSGTKLLRNVKYKATIESQNSFSSMSSNPTISLSPYTSPFNSVKILSKKYRDPSSSCNSTKTTHYNKELVQSYSAPEGTSADNEEPTRKSKLISENQLESLLVIAAINNLCDSNNYNKNSVSPDEKSIIVETLRSCKELSQQLEYNNSNSKSPMKEKEQYNAVVMTEKAVKSTYNSNSSNITTTCSPVLRVLLEEFDSECTPPPPPPTTPNTNMIENDNNIKADIKNNINHNDTTSCEGDDSLEHQLSDRMQALIREWEESTNDIVSDNSIITSCLSNSTESDESIGEVVELGSPPRYHVLSDPPGMKESWIDEADRKLINIWKSMATE